MLYKKITDGKYNIPKYMSEQGEDLISRILITDPSARYNLEDIKNHPWFNINTSKLTEGLLLNINVIPIDEKIIVNVEE